MFKKKMSVRAVKKYSQPAYPVVDHEGKIVFTPQDSKLSEIAKEITKPAIAIALSTIMATSAQAAPARRPEHEITLSDDKDTQDPDTKKKTDDDKKEVKIRKLSKIQVEALVKELDFKMETFEGKGSTVRYAIVTEEQARRILEKFFRKNGITFEYDKNFKRDKVDFNIDAYNSDKKIGYEYDYTKEKELDQKEITNLQELSKNGKEHILLLDANRFRGIKTPQEAVNRVQEMAEQFLKTLCEKGYVKLDHEKVQEKIKALYSDDEKIAKKAHDELMSMGVLVLEALKNVKEKNSFVDHLIEMIEGNFKQDVESYYDQLNHDKPEVRDATSKKLMGMDEAAIPYLKRLLELAKDRKSAEVKSRVESILQEVE